MSAPAAEIVDRDWLRAHGAAKFVAHLDMSDCHQSSYSVVDKRSGEPIGLMICDVGYRCNKRNGARGGTTERVWFVDGLEGEIGSLDEALELLDWRRTLPTRAPPLFPFTLTLPETRA